jgi:hypothetical protein
VLMQAKSSVSSCTDPTHVVNSDCSIDFPLANDDVCVDSVFTLDTLAQRGIARAPAKRNSTLEDETLSQQGSAQCLITYR